MGRRVLITGGAGFIGSHVAQAFVAAGDDVTVLDNLSTGKRDMDSEKSRMEEYRKHAAPAKQTAE